MCLLRMTRLTLFDATLLREVEFSDEHDTRGVWIGISRETGVAVSRYGDMDGRTLLVLSVDDRGHASLIVSDRDRNTRAFQPER